MPAALRKTRENTDPIPLPEDDPHRSICRQVKQVGSSLMRRVDQHMQPLELTGMQWEPVLMLWLKRADTVAGLARVSQMGFASMSRMLDRLEEKDLLRRERSANDRRVVHLHLTAKGKKIANKIWPIVVEGMHVHLDGFKKEELVQFSGFLARMLANGARDAEAK
ncbi:MAG TPA: MarR family transcriptional regulator [Steroidobacteraceae bacterium]|jgi:DNA-binding MarR family transcriptional regulator|nr:MarR family transcriptional regulator [Steroidobacteraceae bacterium]